MRTVGNLLWLVFAGLWISLGYAVGGALLCLTVVGIPFGIQALKLAGFALWPFGREVVRTPHPGGCLETGFNLVWVVLFGWEILLASIVTGGLMCLTIVGIPFGIQAFKLGRLGLWPFGREVGS